MHASLPFQEALKDRLNHESRGPMSIRLRERGTISLRADAQHLAFFRGNRRRMHHADAAAGDAINRVLVTARTRRSG